MPCQVHLEASLAGCSLRKEKQLAYALSDTGAVYLSRSGHGKILRDTEECNLVGGGWVFPSKGKLTLYSGLLGAVEAEAVGPVLLALERALGTPLYVVVD